MDNPSIDLARLKERLDGDKQLFLEITELFFRDFNRQYELVGAAILGSDGKTISAIAHTLKGALANLSAIIALDLAHRLEEAGKAGDYQMARQLIEELSQEVLRIGEFVALVKSDNLWDQK